MVSILSNTLTFCGCSGCRSAGHLNSSWTPLVVPSSDVAMNDVGDESAVGQEARVLQLKYGELVKNCIIDKNVTKNCLKIQVCMLWKQ